MPSIRLLARFACGVTLALLYALLATRATISGQAQSSTAIESLQEPGQGLAIRSADPDGHVQFAAARNNLGILLPGAGALPAFERALRFVDGYGAPFGVSDRGQFTAVQSPTTDALGMEHVRLQQVHQGVPVRGAEFLVHMRGARVLAAGGAVASELPDSVAPSLSAEAAQQIAYDLVRNRLGARSLDAQIGTVRLEILNRGLLDHLPHTPSRLTWFVEITGAELRQQTWIDAEHGVVLFDIDAIADARSRSVYDLNHGSGSGTLVRTEDSAPNGDTDVDAAYDFSGQVYDYYFAQHGRDSYNKTGGPLISRVHYGLNYANAFWDGSQMTYGDGYAIDDVVGHEMTHGVTEYSAGLIYARQSGALNESFSDIFGETIDLTNGMGNDAASVRWLEGEDLPGGAIRNMMTPTAKNHPGKVSDPQLICSSYDNYGVHINSGIPNHAYALMVDGGTYNGKTISGIGLTKAGKIQYRALTNYLTATATFLDNYNAINQSCTDLIGTAGITSTDCAEVNKALEAVEMNLPWPCDPPPPPPMCPTGTPTYTFSEGFETAAVGFTPTSTTVNQWSPYWGYAKTGAYSGYGPDPSVTSDHRYAMTSAVTVPSGGRMYFSHYYAFDSYTGFNFDGGVLEYSIDGGTGWNDAGPLIDAGKNYDGLLAPGNPLSPRPAFTGLAATGFVSTRLNLATLAGQSVKFRFRVASDGLQSSYGWYIDDVSIYQCGSGSGPQLTVDTTSGSPGTPVTVTLTNGAGGAKDWLTLAQVSAVNTNYGNWIYVGAGVTSKTWTTTLPVSGGPFEFRLFADNGFERLATSPAITLGGTNPVPVIGAISPVAVPAGSAGFTLTVNGSNFVNGSVIRIDGSARATTYISPVQMTAAILAGDVVTAASHTITVLSPAPGGGTSNSNTLTAAAPIGAPTIASLNPSSVAAGYPVSQIVYVNGTNFTHSSTLYVNGSQRATTYYSPVMLYATLAPSELVNPASIAFSVVTPAPGGGMSNTVNFAVQGPPDRCTTGTPIYSFFDDFETPNGNFTVNSTTATQWLRSTAKPKNGVYSMLGPNPSMTSDHRLEMSAGITIPANGRLTSTTSTISKATSTAASSSTARTAVRPGMTLPH